MIEAAGVNGQVRFDGALITISRQGLMARATVGSGDKVIPVRSVTAVQLKPPSLGVRGYIQFTVPGSAEAGGKRGSRTTDAAKDENSVVFKKDQAEAFTALRDAVVAAIAAG